MIQRRAFTLRRALQDAWAYERPGNRFRLFLLSFVVAAVVADTLLRLSGATEPLSGQTMWGSLVIVAVALFAWVPPAGVLLIVAWSVIAIFLPGGADYALAMAAAFGLAAATTSVAAIVLYAVALMLLLVMKLSDGAQGISVGGVATIAIIALASFVVGRVLREQQERSRRLRTAVVEHEQAIEREIKRERLRITDELHDIVAHDITLVVMHARALARTDDPEQRRLSQEVVLASAMQALADVRRMLDVADRVETSDAVKTGAFEENITPSADELRRAGIEVTVDAPAEIVLSQTVGFTLGLVAREACMNALKHAAGVRSVEISLASEGAGVVLTVRDDGAGTTSGAVPASGYGLPRMRERVAVVGGTLEAGPDAHGWRVVVRVPHAL